MAAQLQQPASLSVLLRDYRWAHLDVAGTAWLSGSAKRRNWSSSTATYAILANRVSTNG